jgi:hypothetical protein
VCFSKLLAAAHLPASVLLPGQRVCRVHEGASLIVMVHRLLKQDVGRHNCTRMGGDGDGDGDGAQCVYVCTCKKHQGQTAWDVSSCAGLYACCQQLLRVIVSAVALCPPFQSSHSSRAHACLLALGCQDGCVHPCGVGLYDNGLQQRAS